MFVSSAPVSVGRLLFSFGSSFFLVYLASGGLGMVSLYSLCIFLYVLLPRVFPLSCVPAPPTDCLHLCLVILVYLSPQCLSVPPVISVICKIHLVVLIAACETDIKNKVSHTFPTHM